jgi:hypothetical protein
MELVAAAGPVDTGPVRVAGDPPPALACREPAGHRQVDVVAAEFAALAGDLRSVPHVGQRETAHVEEREVGRQAGRLADQPQRPRIQVLPAHLTGLVEIAGLNGHRKRLGAECVRSHDSPSSMNTALPSLPSSPVIRPDTTA